MTYNVDRYIDKDENKIMLDVINQTNCVCKSYFPGRKFTIFLIFILN